MKTLRSREHRNLMALLIAHRNAAKLTQRELAKKLGVPHTVVSKTETGERKLGVLEFIAFAKALGEDPEDLFRRLVHW